MIACACSSAPDKRTLPPDDKYCSEDSLRDFALLLGSADITYDVETIDPKTGKRYAEIQIGDRERLSTEAVKTSAFLVVDVTPLDKGFLVRATCR